jgi:hypothetical protein
MAFKMTHPKDDPIGYLCVRKYPLAYREDSNSLTPAQRVLCEDADEKAEAYREELEGLPHEKMMALFDAEYEKERQQYKEKLRREEQALFFHEPGAGANFTHWRKMANWHLDEAVALSLGKNPKIVNWDSISNYGDRYVPQAWNISEFRGEYARRRELVMRAKSAGDLHDPIKPTIFMRWASDIFEHLPDQLLVEFDISAPEQSAALLNKYPPKLRAAIEAFEAVYNDPTLTTSRHPKTALREWLESNRPDLSNEAKDQIATVANWKPSGGAPKTPGN